MSTAFRPTQGVIFEVVDEEAVLLHLAKGVYFSLNEAGTLVWNRILEGDDRDGIIAQVLNSYHVTTQDAASDVDGLLVELQRQGLVERI